MGRTLLAPAPSNPLVIYAVVISPSDTFTGLYKTVDGGNNWTLTTAPNFCTTQCSYDIAIAVSPTNANIVYAAGIYTFATNTSPGVATTVIGSTNGGATWTRLVRVPVQGQPEFIPTLMPWRSPPMRRGFTPAVTAERGRPRIRQLRQPSIGLG